MDLYIYNKIVVVQNKVAKWKVLIKLCKITNSNNNYRLNLVNVLR